MPWDNVKIRKLLQIDLWFINRYFKIVNIKGNVSQKGCYQFIFFTLVVLNFFFKKLYRYISIW